MKKKGKSFTGMMHFLSPFLLLAVIVVLLEIYVAVSGIDPRILPAPHVIFGKLFTRFRRDLLKDFLYTLRVILTGYCIAIPGGICLAAICSQSKLLSKAITPVIILMICIPMLTVVPILILRMGLVIEIRIIAVVLQALPVICLNTLSGFRKVESAKIELFESLGATRRQIFFKLIFPNAMPQVFTGLKLGCIFSTIAAMGADLAAGNSGLGTKISAYSGSLMTDMAYATIIVVAMIGIVLFTIVCEIEKRVVVWIK
ncbi:MAG: ABC transporter permease [Eubacteriales bacterium]|nr:ABC transporter permease [Eubacteriales bacterium]